VTGQVGVLQVGGAKKLDSKLPDVKAADSVNKKPDAGRLPYSNKPKRLRKIVRNSEKSLIKKVLGGLKMVLCRV